MKVEQTTLKFRLSEQDSWSERTDSLRFFPFPQKQHEGEDVLAIEGLRGDLSFLCCLIFKESTGNLTCRLVDRESDSLRMSGILALAPNREEATDHRPFWPWETAMQANLGNSSRAQRERFEKGGKYPVNLGLDLSPIWVEEAAAGSAGWERERERGRERDRERSREEWSDRDVGDAKAEVRGCQASEL